jgi:drug/metabolite transporter (DMT)-like permease
VLVTTMPVWVALISRALGETVPRRTVIGIALALGGAVAISGGDIGVSGHAAFGDLLALTAAVAEAGYFLAGRRLRQRVSLTTYVGIAYTTAAAILAVIVALSPTAPFVGFEPEVWLLLIAMTLGPQIGGHTVFNYLLGHVDASVVAIAVTGEPVVASILALVFFQEAVRVAGGVLILAGIYGRSRRRPRGRRIAPSRSSEVLPALDGPHGRPRMDPRARDALIATAIFTAGLLAGFWWGRLDAKSPRRWPPPRPRPSP